jgi:hypothetical protein
MNKQPKRAPSDGAIAVRRLPDGRIVISVVTNGIEGGVFMGEFNAWRVFGALALILGIKLSKKLGKSIYLGHEVEMKV